MLSNESMGNAKLHEEAIIQFSFSILFLLQMKFGYMDIGIVNECVNRCFVDFKVNDFDILY